VLDNLNTHRDKSCIATFGDTASRAVWRRFTIDYTPKHGRLPLGFSAANDLCRQAEQ
jgi:hypothetical protein